jgi:hypothetical protein
VAFAARLANLPQIAHAVPTAQTSLKTADLNSRFASASSATPGIPSGATQGSRGSALAAASVVDTKTADTKTIDIKTADTKTADAKTSVAPRPKAQDFLMAKSTLARFADDSDKELTAKDSRVEAVSAGAVGGMALANDGSKQASFETTAAAKPQTDAVADQFAVPEAKAAAPSTASHDIRVSIPDERGGATEVRFVGNSNDVRISVRTPDADLAHTLRSNLNDLTQRLASNGIQTELWRPGAEQSFSQGGSQQPYDPNSSGGGNSSRGQQQQQQEQNSDSRQNKPQWLEEMEASFQARP